MMKWYCSPNYLLKLEKYSYGYKVVDHFYDPENIYTPGTVDSFVIYFKEDNAKNRRTIIVDVFGNYWT
jgi:hypothetical protein